MKFLRYLILVTIIVSLFSCGTLKEGFTNQKKNNNDEFLVEKKSPLVMPPDYGELPVPKTSNQQTNVDDNKIEDMLSNNNLESNTNEDVNENFEDLFLKKIKKN